MPRSALSVHTQRVLAASECVLLALSLLPSTISSESSTKNSFKGGLLGRFSVLRSCWIFVDTLLLTGTPVRGKAMVNSVKIH